MKSILTMLLIVAVLAFAYVIGYKDGERADSDAAYSAGRQSVLEEIRDQRNGVEKLSNASGIWYEVPGDFTDF